VHVSSRASRGVGSRKGVTLWSWTVRAERETCVCVERWIGVVSPPTLKLRLCVSLGVLSAGPLSPLLQPKREASRSRGRKARWSGALCGRFAESAFDWCGACT